MRVYGTEETYYSLHDLRKENPALAKEVEELMERILTKLSPITR